MVEDPLADQPQEDKSLADQPQADLLLARAAEPPAAPEAPQSYPGRGDPAAPFSRPVAGKRLITWAVGWAAGLLNGLIGIGGGILIVPGLMRQHQLDIRAAVSTSLAAVIFLSSLAFAAHVLFAGFRLDPFGSVLTVGAGMLGAQVGGWLLNWLPRRWVILVFGALTLFTAGRLLLQVSGWSHAPVSLAGGPPLWGYPVFGMVSGLLSGLLGVGGGGFVVLGFAVFFDMPVDGGLPVALALNVTNALSGTFAQRGKGHIRWNYVWRLIPSASVGVAMGATLALILPPNLLIILFAGFFLYTGARLIRQALKPHRLR